MIHQRWVSTVAILAVLLFFLSCRQDGTDAEADAGTTARQERLAEDPFSEIRAIGGGGGWDRRARQRVANDPRLRPPEAGD